MNCKRQYKTLRYIICFPILLFCYIELSGQPRIQVFDKISVENGLSSGYVNCIMQDSKGFIWVGTNHGLNRYDGYQSTIFLFDENDENTLSENFILSILEDSHGKIWVGTKGGGLNVYDPENGKFTRLQYHPDDKNSINSNIINCLFEDSQKRLWVGTQEGLTLFNRQDSTFSAWNQYFTCDKCFHSISSISEDHIGNIWVGDEYHGLYYFDTDEKTFSTPYVNYKGYQDMNLVFVEAILHDDGYLWVGMSNGLILLNTVTKEFETFDLNEDEKGLLSSIYVTRLYKGTDGSIWICTGGSGLIHFRNSNRKIEVYTSENSLSVSSNSISDIIIDYSNNLWVSTWGGGVNLSNLKSMMFEHHGYESTSSNTLSNNEVRAIHQDTDGKIWIGTNFGLNRYDPKLDSFRNYVKDFDFQADRTAPKIRVIFRAKNNVLWVGTNNSGLYQYDSIRDRFILEKAYVTSKELENVRDIRCIYETEQGVLWIGTTANGFIEYNPQTKSVSKPNQEVVGGELGNLTISCVEDKSDNEIWLGTESGLVLLNKKTLKLRRWQKDYGNSNSLVGNKVRSLYQDKNDHLWIGTRTGLSKFYPETEEFEQYRVSDGLPSDVIFGILPDDNQSLWLSTPEGLSRLNPKGMKFKNIVIPQNNTLDMGAHTRGLNGRLIVGGTSGFTLFHPYDLKNNPFKPKVTLTHFKVDNVPILLDKDITNVDSVNLSFDQNNITVEFSALEFTDSKKNMYRYYLEGFSEEWVDYGHKHDVTFTNLNSGDYLLHVMGSNNDGIWSDESMNLKITIRPPWWSTWWIKVLYILGAIFLVYAIVFIRTAYLNRRQTELKKLVFERTQELKEKNERIAAQAEELQAYSENLEKQVKQRTNELTRKNKKLAEYAFINAHNLRVPVANIIGIIQLFESDRSKQEVSQLIQIMKEQSLNLDSILLDIQKMLDKDEIFKS